MAGIARRWLVLALVLSAPRVTAQELGWQPSKTWLFVVGPLEWKDAESFTPFPKEGRRDAELVELFRKRGVPLAQIVYLQDSEATSRAIHSELAKLLKGTRPGDLLVLYYCGHGYKGDGGEGYFASYDAGEGVKGWAMAEIPRALEAGFRGQRALLLADACYSGVLARDVNRLASRVSYACLTSSSASASSTGNWTFTEAVLDALRGAAGVDTDEDGTVTLAEMAAHVIADMAIGEEQLATFTATGAFAPSTALAEARPRSNRRVGERVEAQDRGEWWKARIVDARSGELKVHWLGFVGYEDEWVERSQVRPLRGARGYPAGSKVEVEWKGRYYPARILELKGAVHLVHYDGYSDEWDEWVASKRIRLPR